MKRIDKDGGYALASSLTVVRNVLTDEQAIATSGLFAAWNASTSYADGDRVRYDGLLYRCVQGHTSQEGWTPDATPALWTRIGDPGEEWPEWIAPTGGHNAYAAGDKVSHKGKRWISTADANVWEPGVYGWTEAGADG